MQEIKNNSIQTFADLIEMWLPFVKQNVKPSVYSNYLSRLEAHVFPKIGKCKINELKSEVLEEFKNEKLTSGRRDGKGGLSEVFVKDILMLIREIVNFGETENLIPARNLEIEMPKAIKKKSETISLTKEEQARLEFVLSQDTDACKLGVLLCLYTGVSVNELCALKWCDISFDVGMIEVRRTVQRVKNTEVDSNSKTKVIIDPLSEKESRDVPIPDFLIGELKRLCGKPETFFLTNTEKSFEQRSYLNRLKRYVEESGISNEKRISFKVLRDTFAVRYLEKGYDIKSLSELLGDADVKTTLDKYFTPTTTQKQENIKNMKPELSLINRSRKVETLSDLSEIWINTIRLSVNPKSFARYEQLLDDYILPFFEKYTIKELTDEVLNLFIDVSIIEENGLSYRYADSIMYVLKSIIDFGETEKLIPKCNLNFNSKGKEYFKEFRVLSKEEQSKFERVLINDIDIDKFGILVCLYTGLSTGELCALKWKDISLDDETIYVRRILQRKNNIGKAEKNKTRIIIDFPSVHSIRQIPIPEVLIREFKRFYNSNGEAFFLTGTEDYREPQKFMKSLRKYAKMSGISRPDEMTFKALRHTFATRCVEIGFDAVSLTKILGFAELNEVRKYYITSFDKMQTKIREMKFLGELEKVSG